MSVACFYTPALPWCCFKLSSLALHHSIGEIVLEAPLKDIHLEGTGSLLEARGGPGVALTVGLWGDGAVGRYP